MTDLDDKARLAAEYLVELAREMGDDSYARSIYKAMPFYMPKSSIGRKPLSPEDAGYDPNRWRVRLMIFNPMQDLVADSMPDADLHEVPDIGLPTLGAVATYCQSTAAAFHEAAGDPKPIGLDRDELDRRTLALRVNLSRSGGTTWWKLPYYVGDKAWQINVRVHRSTAEDRAPAPAEGNVRGAEQHRRTSPAEAAPPESQFSAPGR